MIIKSDCYKCEDRKVGCHAHCTKYKKYREALDVINNRRREIKESERILGRYIYGKVC